MPLYTFFCRECNFLEDYFHKMAEDKKEHFCPKCEQIMIRKFSINFVIKDGKTGPTPSKAFREKTVRAERSKKLSKKQRERYSVPKLVPNIQKKDGTLETFDSWSEAQKCAKSDGKDSRTFDHLIKTEK